VFCLSFIIKELNFIIFFCYEHDGLIFFLYSVNMVGYTDLTLLSFIVLKCWGLNLDPCTCYARAMESALHPYNNCPLVTEIVFVEYDLLIFVKDCFICTFFCSLCLVLISM
jgi:hypothetical protein